MSITVDEFQKILNISNFEVTKADRETIKISWNLTGTTDPQVEMQLYADTDDKGYDGRELYSQRVNLSGEMLYTPRSLSPGKYYFYLVVNDSFGFPAYKYSGPVEIENDQAPPPVQVTSVTTRNQEILVKWNPVQADIAGYRVILFEAGEVTPLTWEEIQTDTFEHTLAVLNPESAYEVAVVAFNHQGLESPVQRIPVNFNKLGGVLEVEWPQGEFLNTTTVIIPVKFPAGYSLSVYQNGKMLLEGVQEAGGIQLKLEEGENDLSFMLADNQGNQSSEQKRFYVDTVCPQLNVYRDYFALPYKKPEVEIIGDVELGAELTLNETPIQVNQDGTFKYTFPLKMGRNELVLLAKDQAGNTSTYQGTIKYYGNLWLLVGVPLGILLVAGLAFLTWFYRKKRSELS